VAIKELLRSSPTAAERFAREARLTARLQHPGVVPILERGRWPSGEPFYVMKMVSGRPFEEVMVEARTLDERLALLPVALAVADTLAYAHSRRIIHCDVKPENILAGPFGETLLVDWGLGRDLAAGEAGPVAAGTPGYMAPEQRAGRPVDERSDVFALGAVLYRLLLGAVPAEAAPLEPGEAALPPELWAIVRQAMAVDPAARYRSAGELSEDLRRFLTGQLVRAHRYSRLALLRRWAQRHRAALSVAGVLLAALAATATVSVRRIVREKEHAEAERARADARSNALTLSQAESWLDRDPTATVAWLKRYPLDGAEPARARELALEAASRGVARHVLRHGDEVTGGAFTPDGTRFVSADAAGLVRVWSVDGTLRSQRKRRAGITRLRLSPDGRRVATVDRQGHLELGGLDDEPQALGGASGAITALVFSPDGSALAAAGEDGVVRWWDTTTRTARTLSRHRGAVYALAFSPDGGRLASVGWDKTVRLWDARGAGRVVGTQATEVAQLAFHPDGQRLATAGLDGRVWLWDLARESPRELYHHDGTVHDLAFSPDGRWLASAGRDRVVRLIALAGGPARVLSGATDDLYSVVFSPDGAIVIAAGADGAVRLWPTDGVGDSKAGATLPGHRREVSSVVVSPDGATVASLSRDGAVRLWPARLHGRVRVGHGDAVFDVAFSPDGRHLASSSRDQTVRVWDGAASVTLRGHHDLVQRVRFLPDGKRLLSASLDDTVRLFGLDGAGGAPITDGALRWFDFGFALHGGAVAGRGPDETVQVVDLATRVRRVLRGPGAQVMGLALAPDGQRVAGASDDGSVWLWDVASGQARPLGRHGGAAQAVAWSPDGTVIASAGADRVVRLWPSAQGTPRTLTGSGGGVYDVAFSPDGRRLAATDTSDVIRVWDLASGRAVALTGHRESIRRIRFCGDRFLASASWDGTVRVWNVETGASRIAHRHAGYVNALAVSPDGKRIASGGTDATVWVGEVDDGRLLPSDLVSLHESLEQLTSAGIGRADQVTSNKEAAR
jgi:WD40 repeat protein